MQKYKKNPTKNMGEDCEDSTKQTLECVQKNLKQFPPSFPPFFSSNSGHICSFHLP